MERMAAIFVVLTFALAGSLHLWSWARDGDGLPRYIHALALGAAALGVALGLMDRAGPGGQGLGFLVLVILPPLVVYLTFGVFGGHVMEDRAGSESSGGAA